MSINAPSLYGKQFATAVEMLLQQKVSKLRPYVMSGNHKGEAASPVDQIGAVEMQEAPSRFSPISPVHAAVDRRWVFPSFFDLPQLMDKQDELQILSDPKSKYVQNAVAAANRKFDDLLIDAMFGTAYTGKSGSTSTAFSSANQVAVNHDSASNVGLSVAKLIKAKQLLMANQVDLDSDPLTCVITSKQHANLLKEVQIISKDYNEGMVLKEGKLERFLGINFIHCERLDTDGSSYRRVPVFAKSGMYLGIWNDIQADVSQRKDLTMLPWQAYIYIGAGATRLEENKIIEIKCAE